MKFKLPLIAISFLFTLTSFSQLAYNSNVTAGVNLVSKVGNKVTFVDNYPDITLTKSAQNSFCRADEMIEYELTVTNTGNVPLINVIIVDDNIDAAIAPISLIEPGDSVVFSVIHTINHIDRLYGIVINSATVTAYSPDDESEVEDISDDLNNPTSNDDPTIVFQDSDCDGMIDIDDIDDDNDGILDVIENNGINPTTDGDQDGIYQYIDLDDNDATIGANNTPNLDNDGDQIPNHLDIDVDGDGIPDNVEGQNTIDYIVPSNQDVDGNGLDDAYETTPGDGEGIIPQDTDQDSVPDYLDLDSDDDSIEDYIEGSDFDHDGVANDISSGTDVDNDGLDDGFEGGNIDDPYDVNDEIDTPLIDLPDTDLDTTSGGDVDYRDADDDGDSVLTIVEAVVTRNTQGFLDTDGDQIPNYLDNDDDGDGVLTINEDYDGDGNPLNDDTNNDGIADYLQESVALGINNEMINNFTIYPNPVKENLIVKFNNLSSALTIQLYNLQGQQVLRQLEVSEITTIDVSNLSNGVYFIKVSDDNQSSTRKFIKE